MAAKIFCCYAREDEALLNELWAHLIPLQREGLIELWHDRDISAGAEWEQEIKEQLNSAQVILLLVSPDFMASDYVNNVELKRAIERHDAKEARVIPIILRPVYWQIDPLRKLQALPTDGTPVTGASWHSIDEAFLNVVEGIRKVIEPSKKVIEPPKPKPPVPRRAVLAGLAGLAVAISGIAWIASHQGLNMPVVPGHTPTSTPHRTPTPAPSPSPTTTTGTLLYTYRGHSGPVNAVAWSPDSKRIASGSWDSTVQVWDAINGGNVYTYHGHSSYVLAVAWSPDGKRIASASGSITSPSSDHTVQVWVAG